MNHQLAFDFAHLLLSPRCHGCRRKLRPGSSAFCRSCIRYFLGAPSLKGALFEHQGPGKGILRALRGTAPERAAAWAVALLDRKGHIRRWRNEGIELVVHAPQNTKSRSGLALLTEAVARDIGARFVPKAFRKIDEHTQHGRSIGSRMDTSCFLELTRPSPWVKGKQLLVLDDVNTTGTTLDLCAYVLMRAGAAKVHRFALAEQPSEKNSA